MGQHEHFEHDADIGLRGLGDTPAEAFEQVALALTAVVCDPAQVAERACWPFECAAEDLDGLLFEWLNALIYEMAVERVLFGRYEVRLDLDGPRLSARAWGEAVEVARHRPAVEVKGATYTELRVDQDETGRWRAQCVVDV